MKRFPLPRPWLLTAGLITSACGLCLAEDAVLDPEVGKFDAFTANEPPPEPWSVFFVTPPSRIIVSQDAQSPFPDSGPASSASKMGRGLLWEDAEEENLGPMMSTTLESTEPDVRLHWKFDFMVPDTSVAVYAMLNLAETKGSANKAGPALSICRTAGELQANHGKGLKGIAKIESNTWYRVSVTIDQVSKTYDITLQPLGGSEDTVATALSYRNGEAVSLNFLNLAEGALNKEGGLLYLDNISVTESKAGTH